MKRTFKTICVSMLILSMLFSVTYASSDNTITKRAYIGINQKLIGEEAPVLKIENDGDDFDDSETIVLKLDNAKWLEDGDFESGTFEEHMNKDSYIDKFRGNTVSSSVYIEKIDDITVRAKVYNVEDEEEVRIPLYTKPTNAGDMIVHIDSLSNTITEEDIVYGSVKDNGFFIKISGPDFFFEDEKIYNIGHIKIEEAIKQSFPNEEGIIKIELQEGFKWIEPGNINTDDFIGKKEAKIIDDSILNVIVDFSKEVDDDKYHSIKLSNAKIQAVDQINNYEEEFVYAQISSDIIDIIEANPLFLGIHNKDKMIYYLEKDFSVEQKVGQVIVDFNKLQLKNKYTVRDIVYGKENYDWILVNENEFEEAYESPNNQKKYKITNGKIIIDESLKKGKYILFSPEMMSKLYFYKKVSKDDLKLKFELMVDTTRKRTSSGSSGGGRSSKPKATISEKGNKASVKIDKKNMDTFIKESKGDSYINVPITTDKEEVELTLNSDILKEVEKEIRMENKDLVMILKKDVLDNLKKDNEDVRIGLNKKPMIESMNTLKSSKYSKIYTQVFKVDASNDIGRIPVIYNTKIQNRKMTNVFVIGKDSKLHFVPSTVEENSIKFEADEDKEYVIIEKNISFNDLNSHWAKDAVEGLASKNIISGFENGEFKPDDNLDRAQMATILVKALGLDTFNEDNNKVFEDMDTTNWASEYVYLAKENGLINGVGNNKFNPNGNITGEQLIQVAINAYEKNNKKIEVTKEEIEKINGSSDWAKIAIAKAKKLGLEDNILEELSYKGNAKRSQAAAIISELIKD
ncbi:S-layer homology domain-containing protein [Anaeromicrobium sediminis]|uniref:S-layer homology domain-containing protein n=1 Tax=Anaeromicrobium sediminis TaxID=1478221 RepID=UPI001595DB6D|nr:S-layer homology domain-containing protein [Anaeromicrobium sediminis]